MTKRALKIGAVKSAEAWARSFLWVFTNQRRLKVSPDELQRAVEYFASTRASKSECSAAAAFLDEYEDLFQSLDKTDSRLVLVGPNGDGGYWTFNPTHFSQVLSGGAGDNIDFEATMDELGCHVVIFDPYVKALPRDIPRIQWVKEPLGKTRGSDRGLSLHEACVTAGFRLDLQTVVKLDIEGSEWDVLDAQFANLGQLIVEFHNMHRLHDKDFRDKAARIFGQLREHFVVVAVRPNNYRPLVTFDSWAVADTFEVSLVNRQLSPRREIPITQFLPDNSADRPSIMDVLSRIVPIESSTVE